MVQSYKNIIFHACIFLISIAVLSAQKSTTLPRNFQASGDIFGDRNFIENKGQFRNSVEPDEPVLFVFENGNEKIHFTRAGLIYEHNDHRSITHEEMELMEHGKHDKLKPRKKAVIQMKWEGSSRDVMVEGREKQGHYFTYGSPDLNSYAFKKILYRNIYRNIDIEYEIAETKSHGVKYTVIVHPGASPSDVKMVYSGDIKQISKTADGTIKIRSILDEITEYAPESFSEKKKVASSFILNKNTLSFETGEYARDKDLIIDPWVTAITTLSLNNNGYDVDFDFTGNLYVYGGNQTGSGRCRIAKYNNVGALLWTFSGVVTTPAWNSGSSWSSNFKVNRGLGKAYMGKNTGTPNVIRLDAAGNYDNFVSNGTPAVGETWNMELNCVGDLFVFGGANTSFEIVDATTGSITVLANFSSTITGCCQDVVSNAIDAQGNIFVLMLGHLQYNHKIMQISQTFTNIIWWAASGLTSFTYLQNKNLMQGGTANGPSVAFNALAVNQNYLYGYDGASLVAYNKTNGATIASVLISGQTPKVQGGIAVDGCDNVYVGGDGNIKCFNFNGTSFSTLTPISLSITSGPANVYDIALNVFNNQLYVSGSSFVGNYPAIHSTTCSPVSVVNPCNFGQGTITASSTSITCSSLGSATVSAVGGLGPFSYTWFPTAQTGSVATGLSPGMYTVVVEDLGALFQYTANAFFAPLVPLSGNVQSSFGVPCFGATTATAQIVNLAGGSGSQSYLWTNGITTQTTPVITGLGAGNYSVTVTDSLTGCLLVQNFSIYEPAQLSAFIIASTPTACVGDSITMTVLMGGGVPSYDYLWTGGPTTNTFAVTQLTGGVVAYSVTGTDFNTCTVVASTTLNFIPYPTLSVTTASICPFETGTISVSGANNYTWAITNSNSNTFSDNPLSNTIYTVSGEALMCTSTATGAILIKPLPNPTASNNSPICDNRQLQLQAGGGTSYVWTGPQNYNAASSAPVISPATLPNAGVYNVTVTAANGCTATTSTTVSINPLPVVAASGGTLCTTQTIGLSSNANIPSTFSWFGPLGFSSSQQNPLLVNPPTNAGGFYTVVATAATGCTNAATASLSVINPPSLSIQLSSNTICAQNLNLSPNTTTISPAGGISYTLVLPPMVSNSSPVPPYVLSSSAPQANSITSYSPILIGSNGVCTSTTSTVFSVIPNPQISVSDPNPEICAGRSFTFLLTGADSYNWGPSPPGVTLSSGGAVAVAGPMQSAVYSVYGSSSGCNSGNITPSITVHPIPSLYISPAETTICVGNSIELKALGTATSFSWTPPIGLNNVAGPDVIASPKTNQTYTLIGSANNCTNITQATVNLWQLPKPNAWFTNSVVCLYQTVQLNGEGGSIYNWGGPAGLAFIGKTVGFGINAMEFAGAYTLTVTDSNGCRYATTTHLRVDPLPTGVLRASKAEACVPFCSDFYFESEGNSVIKTQWEFQKIKFNGNSFRRCFSEPGEYIFRGKLEDSITHCVNTASLAVYGREIPSADFIWLPENPVENSDQVLFTNRSSGAELVQFNWFFSGATTAKTSGENVSTLFKDAGTYPVAMIVKNIWNCSDSVVKAIKVLEDFTFFVPNTFSPNGDNLNEVFIPIMRGVKLYRMSVFDRWGHKVFETSDPLQGWDGTYKGSPCKQDIYTYKVNLSTIHGESKELDGHVTILR